MTQPDRTEETSILLKRLNVLDRLCRAPAHIRDLVEETEHSRRTINRAVTELEAKNFVERGSNGIEATTAGRLARERLDRFLAELDDVLVSQEVLEHLPADADIDPTVVAGGDTLLASEPASFRPLERMHEELIAADRYRALVPTLKDARHVRLLYEHVISRGNPAELVVTPEVFDTLREEFPRRMAAMAEVDTFSLLVGPVPPFNLGLFERNETEDGWTSVAHLVVLTESGGVHGSIVNDTDAAVEWAEVQYETYRKAATDRTDALVVDTDGGVQSVEARPSPSLPAPLERDGFVAVDIAYFGDKPVADPQTAWRAGFSLAEVHTGYAIERPPPDADGTSADEASQEAAEASEEGFASMLEADLAAGSNCALLGPPGSGKSTTCKQVACRWYTEDRGLVLYRETGRGRPFAAVDALVETVTAADGHTLVVVEDATRQGASEVLDAIDRLAGRQDVSFLLDAREHEWYDRVATWAADADINVAHVSPIQEADCAALVTHFERTTGRSVEVSVDNLWSAVRTETESDSGGCHELLRLTHRLATYADPLTTEPTALEDEVAAVHEDLTDEDLAMTVCTLATTLVAAGIPLERGVLYAVAEDGDLDAVDGALDRLEGRVLFPLADGTYRTVHEEWATTFLDQLLEDDEDAASRRFRSTVTALLALADDTDRRERIAHHLDDEDALGDVVNDPVQWVGETLEAVYDLFWRRVSLTPLLGDGTEQPFDRPDACSDSGEIPGPFWIGQQFAEAGYIDHAKRAYERLDTDDDAERCLRLRGLGNLCYKRGEYEEAITQLEEGLPIARERGDLINQFCFNKYLGLSRWRVGRYDEARDHLETAIELARRLDDQGLEKLAQRILGGIAWATGEYEQARAYNEMEREYTQQTGNRPAYATASTNLGLIACLQGAYDRAEALHEESLSIVREVGMRHKEANTLNNLGHVALERGSHEEAHAFLETALEVANDIESSKHEGESHWRLGGVAIDTGDFDDAERHLKRAEVIFEETGNQLYIARVTLEQARLALKRERTAAAFELAEDARSIAEELDAMKELSECRTVLGRIGLAEGNPDRAREHWEEAVDVFQTRGMYDDAFGTLERLVELGYAEDDRDEARMWYQRACDLLEDAPDAVVERHREWVETHKEQLQ